MCIVYLQTRMISGSIAQQDLNIVIIEFLQYSTSILKLLPDDQFLAA